MDCSIVVPTLGGDRLGRQLAAISGQSVAPAKIVVVNNGPPGAVDDCIRRWQSTLPQLELAEDVGRRGPGYARNVGASRAVTPGILFVDDDDVIAPDYVAAMSAALDEFDAVGARVCVEQLNSPKLTVGWDGISGGLMTDHGVLPWTFGGSLGIRRDVFERAHGFDAGLRTSEDTDLCWRIQLSGASLGFARGATVHYQLRTSVSDAYRQAAAWGEGEVTLYRRYRDQGLVHRRNQARAVLRWCRPIVQLCGARRREDLVVAARSFGARLGRLRGSLRQRCLYL